MNIYLPITMLAGLAMISTVALATDTDGDGIDDETEATVLSALAPVWFPEASRRLQPIDWMVRHGFAKVFRRDNGSYVGRIPATDMVLPPYAFLDLYDAARVIWPESQYEYRWAYFNVDHGRDTNDPNDPFDWSIAQATGQGIYGRVTNSPDTPGLLQVQYFVHFGFNETDAPPGCDAGNHEGDWIGVDFDVDATDPASPRIVRAWYHNHGRQIFIQSADQLNMSGTHPHVYLERGVQETWPFTARGGFQPGSVPACISTNRQIIDDIFGICSMEYENGCNQGYTSVREHEGLDGGYLISPMNIGERGYPTESSQADFILSYGGLYGSFSAGGCWYLPVDLLDASSPPGPPFLNNGTKMWDRNFDRSLDWSSWADQATVWASPTGTPNPDGSFGSPMRTLNGALGVVAADGQINLGTGTYSDGPMTITQPVTITAPNGAAIINP